MNNKAVHTVLGANGAVGQAVINALKEKGVIVKGVSRNGQIEGVITANADLLDAQQTMQVVEGSGVVYLCIGLPYRTRVWATQWEAVMQNVIEACAAYQATLVFLDNIYLYKAPLPVPFDEDTLQQPPSEKGKARKRTTDLMLKAMQEGKIQGVIGRAADFYGPNAVNSPFYISFLERMLEGKSPQALSNPEMKHTYANVVDVGRGLVALAEHEDCYGKAWHLPVGETTTINEMLALFNAELKSEYKLQVLPKVMRKLLSLFIPPLKEISEMMYQFEADYVMSFERFQNRFPDFKVTPYREGVKQMIDSFKERNNVKSNL